MVESNAKKTSKTYIHVGYCHTNERGGDDCGYCDGSKGKKGHASWGLGSFKMTCQDYETIMWRGWRRCGTYYYKWDFEQSCC